MTRPSYPLFDRYKRQYLERITGYTIDYLKKVMLGHRRANPTFRAKVVTALEDENIDEEALFGKDTD